MTGALQVARKRGGRPHGRRPQTSRYVIVSAPGHARSNAKGRVAEHVLIAERALGRPLAAEHPVHHVDRNRANNANGNLVLCEDAAYHSLLHQRQRALEACGDANALRCHICYGYDRQSDISQTTKGRAYHRSCNALVVKRHLRAKRGAR